MYSKLRIILALITATLLSNACSLKGSGTGGKDTAAAAASNGNSLTPVAVPTPVQTTTPITPATAPQNVTIIRSNVPEESTVASNSIEFEVTFSESLVAKNNGQIGNGKVSFQSTSGICDPIFTLQLRMSTTGVISCVAPATQKITVIDADIGKPKLVVNAKFINLNWDSHYHFQAFAVGEKNTTTPVSSSGSPKLLSFATPIFVVPTTPPPILMAACKGTPLPCNTNNNSSCSSIKGCLTQSGASCEARDPSSSIASCSGFSVTQCSQAQAIYPRAAWNFNLRACSGCSNDLPCTKLTNANNCSLFSACYWNSPTTTSCTGRPTACSVFVDQQTCATQPGCSWSQ